jgi:hypothetical protein
VTITGPVVMPWVERRSARMRRAETGGDGSGHAAVGTSKSGADPEESA